MEPRDPRTDGRLCVGLHLQGRGPSEALEQFPQTLRGQRGLNSLSSHGAPGRAESTPRHPRTCAVIPLQVLVPQPWTTSSPHEKIPQVGMRPRPQVGTTVRTFKDQMSWPPVSPKCSHVQQQRLHLLTCGLRVSCPQTHWLIPSYKQLRNGQ